MTSTDAEIRGFGPVAPAGDGQLLGWAPGNAAIDGAAGQKRAVTVTTSVLPELTEAETKPRPLWRHPAFYLSVGLAFVAVIVGIVMIVVSVNSGGPKVTTAAVDESAGNAHVTWSASDAAVDLYVVTGEEVLDLSQLVRAGEQAWVPAASGYYDETSCFVVRPSDADDQPVSLDSADLEAQGAARACVGG
ncbi:hypothetical protein [Desertivibrio insolitus]|uniref:hypothetical protein n=1 Tax=Herbiconiux sp. SYSU D00978 TaxID=2812562 RepID=UPI001A965A1D|nr:hypothetical protein [Herbiconiux sp. SYSU D00978]